MNCLIAIETSTRFGGIALFRHKALCRTIQFSRENPASEHLVPGIRDMLKAESIGPSEVSAVAVSIGPGSFTGLRVGLTAAKTLASQLCIPVYSVSSLLVLAAGAGEQPYPVAAVMDARKNEIYGAYFSATSVLTRLSDDRVMTIEAFLGSINAPRLFVIGDVVFTCREAILNHGVPVDLAIPGVCYPSAECLGNLVFQNHGECIQGKDVFRLTPAYLRKSEAEVNREKNLKRK